MIGISPGTRTIGIAVIKDGTLIDWGVKIFKGEWSEEKRVRIIKSLEAYIIRYGISHMALKRIHPSRSSEALEEVVSGILTCAKRLRVKVKGYTMEELKRRCNGSGNKNSLTSYVFQNYPEVEKTTKITKNNFLYHLKTIEADSLAHVLSQ
mgnify:CR=1 FL=1